MKRALTFALLFILLGFDTQAQSTNGTVILPTPTVPFLIMKQQSSIVADNSNNIWVGYYYNGIGKFKNGNWTMYDSTNSGLLSNRVYALAVDVSNNIWIGTKNGLQKFDGTTFQSFTTVNSGLINDEIISLFTKGNSVYVGTNFGISIFDGTNWTNYTKTNSNLVSDIIYAITVTDNNTKYFGTNNGLSSLDASGNWTTFNTVNAGIDNKINALLADTNTVYIGTNTTTYQLANGIINSFEMLFPCTEGLSFSTYSIVKSSTNKIYFGDLRNGLTEFANNTFKRFSLSPVFDNAVYAITPMDSIFIIKSKVGPSSNPFLKYEPALYTPIINIDSLTYLDINNVKASISNNGSMHWDLLNIPKYTVPKCSGVNAVYASALWLGGLDASNQLHLAAQTYRQTGNDFFPGPIDTITLVADSVSSAFYNKIWKLERNTINEFNYEFALGNVTNGTYVIPTDILTWPAHGILNNAHNLAPFIDTNNDGNYNPYDGDYPQIKGDQYLYWIFNDNLKTHTETAGLPLGVEVHACAYAYACPQLNDSDQVMNFTTFYQYKIINRSTTNYHEMYIGLWSDMDLGKATDDFVGCDTTLDIGFTYNGDNDDDGAGSYGVNPPMQNIAILKGPVAANADGKDNNHNGVIDEANETLGMTSYLYYNNVNNTPNGNPYAADGHYHYMKSEWMDAQHVTYGNDGRNTSNPLTNYMFPGTPFDTAQQWNETTSGNTPEDRRFVMSSGPFNLNAGDTSTIDFAYIFTRDESAPNGVTTSVARNIKDVKKIRDWYQLNSFPSCITVTNLGLPTSENPNNELVVYPNPSNEVLHFYMSGITPNAKFFVYNIYGQLVTEGLAKNKIINITDLSNGVYFLKVADNDKVNVKRFIKM